MRISALILSYVVVFASACSAASDITSHRDRSDVRQSEPRPVLLSSVLPAATCPGGFPSTLANGSFETPFVNGFGLVSPSLTSWSTTDSDVEIWGTSMGVPDIPDGVQFAELNAYLKYGNLWQDLCIPVGTPLTISFAHRGRSTVEALEVAFIDLGANGTFDETDAVLYRGRFEADPSAWVRNAVATGAVAVANPMRLRVLTVDPVQSASFGNLIDDIVLNGGVAPPPPPNLDPGPLPGPAKTGDVINAVRGGQTVPLKFRFLDESKALISDTDMVDIAFSEIPCVGPVSDVKNAKGSDKDNTKPGLRFNAHDQAFMYHWRTPSETGGCVLLEASLSTIGVSASVESGNYAAWKFMFR